MSFADDVAKAVLASTKEWAAIKKKQERDRQQAARMMESYSRGRSCRVTVKEAAYAAIPAAYAKASGTGQYPANARQIMYAARPAIQEATDQALKDAYFTQTLLPDYMREHPTETAGWDVVYDARGHLWEPHTSHEVALGTIGVREYLSEIGQLVDTSLQLPEIATQFPTRGPRNRYSAILYIEKEGFLPLLQKATFSERYDLAIMSSKGMGTTSVRQLVEKLSDTVAILVLHDFDKSGFSIVGTLTRDTRRYTFETDVTVIDLGLRLEDVEKWKLQTEDVAHTSDPEENLVENGATDKEVEFLRGKRATVYSSRHFNGRRVELNAFTSNQFVSWLEAKLKQHGIQKVIPDANTLQQAYRRAAAIDRLREIQGEELDEVEEYAARLKVPTDLNSRLKKELARNPSHSWDQALERLLPKTR